ncbi:MAG: poly-gamma-glutamate biosynthesis protein PgsC [Deltaproteobacteria bacterium]|nr:poly-gamma-glutamate biosynthesis protein PgsC [Deltaproteobacteria bacterium]
MVELLSLSIGLGLAVSLLFVELFGVAVGGMVVPGYVALYMDQPLVVAVTLGVGFLTYAVVQTLSSVVIIYGRRRTVLMIILGYIFVMALAMVTRSVTDLAHFEVLTIGYIIPGLLAIWMDRQGVVVTVCSLLIAAVVVRLLLILTLGTELEI